MQHLWTGTPEVIYFEEKKQRFMPDKRSEFFTWKGRKIPCCECATHGETHVILTYNEGAGTDPATFLCSSCFENNKESIFANLHIEAEGDRDLMVENCHLIP